MKELKIVEYNGKRVLTTQQIAEFYETDAKHINDNYQNNKDRYILGKHFFLLEGSELKQFKIDNPEIFGVVSRLNKLYLWTEKGVVRHARHLGTSKAWDVWEILEETYFRVQENAKQEDINEVHRRRRDANVWLIEKMRFTVDEKTNIIALSGILKGLGFAANAFLDTSLGIAFNPWCEEQGYDMSLVKKSKKAHLVGYELNGDGTPDWDRPIWTKVHSYPEDPFGLAWTKFLVEYYWPEKFLPYITRKYRGEERANNITSGIKVISFYTGFNEKQIIEKRKKGNK